jgi:hypothetical protein
MEKQAQQIPTGQNTETLRTSKPNDEVDPDERRVNLNHEIQKDHSKTQGG